MAEVPEGKSIKRVPADLEIVNADDKLLLVTEAARQPTVAATEAEEPTDKKT